MPHHENKKCPRCNRVFECKVGNIAECQCSSLQLTYEERVFIEGQYLDCLCAKCLETLQFQYRLHRHNIFRF
ncbi:MAG: cysteine-rich CWC family protein [Chitinophagaceae bacterium]|nr:cysteine-rich CWC family protein [Chitinophagaceae bacterium]